MNDTLLPAISIRQPWASLIVMGLKPIENRTWATKFRGRILIHAAKGVARTRSERTEAMQFLALRCPGAISAIEKEGGFEHLQRGGIIGEVTITDCVTEHPSPYFVGPYGFVLAEARPLPFTPMAGKLGIFRVPAASINRDTQ